MAALARAVMTVCFVGCLSACSNALTVRGVVVQPARVPVRAFPRILVTSTDDAESLELADAIARHLSHGRSYVDRITQDDIEGLRATGRIRRATVVVEVRASVLESAEASWGRSEELECGPAGCLPARRLQMRDIPVLDGALVLAVSDGPSGRTLQRVELSEEESGLDVIAMRLRVLDRLATGALALLDQRAEQVPVQLYPIDDPDVLRALDAVRAGSWEHGRRLLSRFVRSPRFGELSRPERALVLYDLGQTMRFDVTLEPEERFEGAEHALSQAVRLSPQPLYARALADLEAHRRSRAMVREQAEATVHNFGLAEVGTPAAPPTYGY